MVMVVTWMERLFDALTKKNYVLLLLVEFRGLYHLNYILAAEK